MTTILTLALFAPAIFGWVMFTVGVVVDHWSA